MEIPKKIKDEIWEYCRLNNITDVEGFTQKMLKQGFTVEKFGAVPNERVIEKEVEKIVEVPVEKIVEKIVEVVKEVEVIKEVDKIVEVIKEIEVIKEVQVTDDVEMQKLIDEIVILKKDNMNIESTSKSWETEVSHLQRELV